jgi:hypothetical protein
MKFIEAKILLKEELAKSNKENPDKIKYIAPAYARVI